MAAQSSLYNEDRNLLRMRERERRSQEALQGRDNFPQKIPLFAEPYKTTKEDELSSRIQNMLGNYEEVKEFISNRSHQDFIGIPKAVSPLLPQGRPARPYLPAKPSHALPSAFHAAPQQPPTAVAAPAPPRAAPCPRAAPAVQPPAALRAKGHCLPSSQSTAQERGRGGQESHVGSQHRRSDRRAAGEGPAEELQASLLALSPLLSSLSSPLPPLSPLHSSQQPAAHNGSKTLPYSQAKSSQDLVTGSQEQDSRDSPAPSLTSTPQPSSQAFPQPLPSKPSAMQQKPTAYVRPMDGQEQAPVESPELKPLLEEYHGKISDLKANAKAKLSKLEIPAEPLEQTFLGDVHSIEDILKEMTHSWPPPLTAIHTPSTAEPSKFPFPAKEPQHAEAAAQSQKQYEAPSKPLPASQPRTSMLQEDLHLSDSEESGDDQVAEKPPSVLAPPGYSALQSQPKSVASAHSSSLELGSTSDSDSSSDSETESSDSEATDPPRVPAAEPDPPTCNKWQLDNWLTKVNPPAVPTESLSDATPGHGREEDKEQEQAVGSNSCQQPPEPREPQHKGCSRAARTPRDAALPAKRSCQESPGRAQEPSPRHTVGIKRPSKAPLHEEPKGGLKVESDPGPFEDRDQPCRDKPKVKTKAKAKCRDRKDPKPALPQPPEKRKHKSSHQAAAKPCVDPKPVRDVSFGSAQEHLTLSPLPQGQGTTPTRTSSHRSPVVAREDCHKEKLPLPGQENKVGSPMRDSSDPQSLVVKIHLPLLARVPQSSEKGNHQRRAEAKEQPGARQQDLGRKGTDPPDKPLPKRKRKMEEVEGKKHQPEKKAKPLLPSSKKDSSKLKTSKASCETQKQDLLLPPALPPKSPAPRPSKVAPKRPASESSELPDTENTARSKSSHKDPLISKHRKVERNHPELSKGIKESAGDVSKPFPVPSLPNGTSKPRRAQLKAEKQHPVEYYREEAKRLKHKADAMTDKTGKAIQYLDAALTFIEYGMALELDAPAPKSASSIFRDTIELIQFITTVRAFTGSSASSYEEIFLVLCMRCQALLHMAMFQHKRETAVKYCRVLGDLLKSPCRAAPAASPCAARSTGMPSPLSPMPSPAGSGTPQPGSNASSSGGNSTGSTVTVPGNVPTITSAYVNITSHILQACELWEQADALARKNKEAFAELSTASGPLALTSSLRELLHYTRQGLQWLRMETNTP
ncbi:AF4/FMR2 family member 1 isoform X2 [Pogoniulus pusillus]|uniref:AF4/FMR2 family member 1 isoform X2 n=1 Tax=Pogoniulus pusillus TaxID=488313 RepID=UPI0030B99D01